MKKHYTEFILERYSREPLITPADFPGAQAVFNPGQTMLGNKTILLVSIGHRSSYYRGVKGATTHVAESEDGINFTINPEPFLQHPPEEPWASVDFHPIDTRITKIEDEYYVVHPGCGAWGTFGILGKTTDFKKHEYVDIISLPDNRVPCLFPEKINGKYYRLDRPYRVAPNNFHNFGNIWTASSPDLINWGSHRPLLKGGYASWAGTKIGPTPPIKTDKGWLVLIHGVSQSCDGHRYCLGAILLDLEDPTKLIGKTNSHILSPCEIWEQNGVVPNVVFACGAIPDYEEDRIRVYYGGADTSIGLAQGSLSELIDACLKEL
jgi:beta-1,4-mannooligosaccharide/beta-1,4-mannosyl-N-acetylglucosamine phosphorylase